MTRNTLLVLRWLTLAVVILLLDQYLKLWVLNTYQLGEGTAITSFFNLVRVHNTGAAFSFLAQASGWQRWFFIGLGAVATVVLIWLLRKHASEKMLATCLALLLGGALGNVIDRAVLGYVVDFLDFHWQGTHFPAFNLADCALTVGAIGLIVDEFLRARRAKKTEASPQV